MSATAEALFGNKPSIEAKEAREGFSVSYQLDFRELNFGRELGRGGFGVVHQGTWRKHTDVAIKQLLSDDISHEAKEEFETESQVMARLRSPNIVQFYGYCLNPRHCIVMEYMPNGSLYSVLKNTKQPLDWTIRIRIAIDMASGLAFLHQEHIVHRDIKSLNVLLDQSYRAKLTDFGLSKVKTETKSQSMATKTSKESVGTVAWMAPELFKRKAVYTPKSDIYSLGITFWELAARKIPYSSDPQEAIPAFVQKGEREDIPKDCPQKLASLIAACWEGSPDKRPDADIVVTYLKSDTNDFVQFLPLFASHRASEYQSNLHSIPTATAYQGNFNSVLSGLNNLQVTPPVPKPVIPEQKNALVSATPTQFNQTVKSTSRVSPSDLKEFLKLVAEGEQYEAEKMLKKNPDLALAPGDVTDLSKRSFTNITAFQYAVWALDWHMWTMLLKYLPRAFAAEQAQSMKTGSWVREHGTSASWQPLLDAIQKYIGLYDKASGMRESSFTSSSKTDEAFAEASMQWNKQVGSAQRLLPVHVVNEYCRPDRPFKPCPDFNSPTLLPRSRTININEEWHTASNGSLGNTFAYVRHSFDKPEEVRGERMGRGGLDAAGRRLWTMHLFADLTACRNLLTTRMQQRDQLFSGLSVTYQAQAGVR